jgi:predicted dehydrogenase
LAYQVKIYGAGSIGNHLAHAALAMGWQVTICDISDDALARMKSSIYPSRYGKWDDRIQLFTNDKAPRGNADLIFIGTPPDVHLDVALAAFKEEPRAVLIEKPLCTPSLDQAHELYEAAKKAHLKVFVGYDHVVGHATQTVEELLRSGTVGPIVTMDVEFREHWAGIFAAHPWLAGPNDSYLGFWERGGGASGEHSHAINLWQHFAHVIGVGRVTEVGARVNYVRENGAYYDNLCFVDLRTDQGFIGRVAQDVVTRPSRKRARLQGMQGSIEWLASYSPEGDAVIVQRPGEPDETHIIKKSRADDFIQELKRIESDLLDNDMNSPISLERGLDTMLVVAAAHLSERESRRVRINYQMGYRPEALIHVDMIERSLS